jgi:hypothetical protein
MIMESNPTVKSVTKFITVYLTWLVFSASQFALLFWLHDLIFAWSILLGDQAGNPWLPRAVDMWSMFLLGMIALAAIFWTEAHLRKGMDHQHFWRNAGRIALVEGILALVMLVIDKFLL